MHCLDMHHDTDMQRQSVRLVLTNTLPPSLLRLFPQGSIPSLALRYYHNAAAT